MKVMMVFREGPDAFAERADPDRADAYWAAWMAYVKAVRESGLVVEGAGLQGPETATQLRIRDGAREVQDGPYADAVEQLGGYFVLEAPDKETALAWAAKSPAASYGSVELRPVLPPPGSEA